MKLIQKVILHKFPTHVMISQYQKEKWRKGKLVNKSRVGKPLYQKISLQALYNGQMHPQVRAKVISAMHKYIHRNLRNLPPIPDVGFKKSIVVRGMLYAPVNFGTARMVNDQISHKPIKLTDEYEPNWDIYNFGGIWVKAFEDCIKQSDEEPYIKKTREAIIPEDTVKYISGSGEMRVRFVDTFAERKIVFNLYIDDQNECY